MKLKWLVGLGAAGGFAVLVVWLVPAPGGQAVAATPFLALSRVPVPEMPAKAADLVQAAPVLERETTAAAVLRAVATMARPGAMPYVVSAICRRNPEVAGAVVATAIQLQPDDELAFCRAAVCAAPDRVEQVVASACTAAPPSFANVAMVAFGCRPDADHLILGGLTNALPGLKPYLDEAAREGGTNDFATLINQTVQLVTDAAKAESKKRK
jgi:hypothetical protein